MMIRKQSAKLLVFVILIFRTNCKKENETIYILIWTLYTHEKWNYRGLENEDGQEAFIRRNCSFQNCYMTTNRKYLKNVLDYDVLIFNTVQLSQGYPLEYMPGNRSANQLYVLFSVEPAAYTSIPVLYDGIFNLTWTYLLKSDIVHPYLLVKNNCSKIVAPKKDVQWTDVKEMASTNKIIVQKLRTKSIAALWVASNCGPKRRLVFVQSLNDELSKYGHRLDIYGRCGDQTICHKIVTDRNGVLTKCFDKIESDYYFYLAFENSFTEDYVSEKVLHGLLHFSVPIVLGGANYTRFLPDGIYLNALELGVERLAKEMNDIIKDPQRYYDFFKWHGYYSFHDTGANNYRESVCAFCAFLNKKSKRSQVYKDITGWWDAPYPEEFDNTERPNRTTPLSTNFEILDSSLEAEEVTPSSFLSKIINLFFD